jgi:MbtH protein
MNNPFDDENETFHVVVNEEGQHSLWPNFIEVPQGWMVVLASRNRATCADYVDQHWIDMRPKILVKAVTKDP